MTLPVVSPTKDEMLSSLARIESMDEFHAWLNANAFEWATQNKLFRLNWPNHPGPLFNKINLMSYPSANYEWGALSCAVWDQHCLTWGPGGIGQIKNVLLVAGYLSSRYSSAAIATFFYGTPITVAVPAGWDVDKADDDVVMILPFAAFPYLSMMLRLQGQI